VRALWLASIAIPACVSLPSRADSLDEIAIFAEKICSQSLRGGETSTTITANLNGDVNGLAKALGISVGAGGLVKKDGVHYEGIPENRLPNSIPTPAQCKFELAKVLIEERQRLGEARAKKSTRRVNDDTPSGKPPGSKTQASDRPNSSQQTSPKPLNLTGMWRDIGTPTNVSWVEQTDNLFRLDRTGNLTDGTRFITSGRGTIVDDSVTVQYAAQFSTGASSSGTCTGSVTATGDLMTLKCKDSVLGAFEGSSERARD